MSELNLPKSTAAPAILKNVIAVSPVAIAIFDTNMRYLAVSEKWINYYSLHEMTIIGKSHYEVFPEIPERWKKIYAACLSGTDYQIDDDSFKRPNGTTMWIKWEVKHWLADDGSIGGLSLSSEDITSQKEMETSELRFRLFIENLPGLCSITDRKGILKYANNHFLDTLHLTKDVIGKENKEIFGAEVADDIYKNNQVVLNAQESMEFYQTIKDSKGILQYYRTYKFPFTDGNGEKNMIGAIGFDMTKHKQLEEDLYQSESQFKQAFEHSLIGMALISPEGRWERVNDSLYQILGYTEKELSELTIHDITYWEDLEASVSSLTELAEGKTENMKMEKRYVHKSGAVIWVVIAATMLKDSSGKPLHYISQIEDITKRKEIENDLVLSEKKYRTIFENVQDVFYLADNEGFVTEISPSITEYSGFTREEIIGKNVIDFYYYPQDRDKIVEILKTKGMVVDFEVRLKTKNQELKYTSVNARLIIQNGVLIGTEGSMRDVTTRKYQENALKVLNSELTASNLQKNNLLSIIGHDLRNPISGSLQLLDLTLSDFASSSAEEVHTYLSKMKDELGSANDLLEDLLTWAKSQFNAISYNPVNIYDLPLTLKKVLQNVLPMANRKNISIVQDIDTDLTFAADIGMLETILRNLISNAVKFTKTGGEITIRAKNAKTGVKFSVTDNGVGIPKDKISQLFDKNSNYTTYGTLNEKGTGLGLNICYDFTIKHGGQLWVESEEGIGSTFYFTIPVS